jgi:hypothetical protein
MLLSHAVTLAQARSYLAALADTAGTFEASLGYDRVLLQLDVIHGDDTPALCDVPGVDRDFLYVVAEARARGARELRRRRLAGRAPAGRPGGRPGPGRVVMYGENSASLRAALTSLLHQHRIQQRIGGPGLYTVPETTTPAEREQIGRQIRRYRHGVLTWTLQAVTAANPEIDLYGTTNRSRGPAEELRYRLQRAVQNDSTGLAPLEELSEPRHFALAEAWRHAARAAALGEHDFGAGVGYAQLDQRQCMTVLKDVADVACALVVLDKRYRNIPGWEHLPEPVLLGRAAATAATFAGYDDPDYTVDRRGWRPPATLIDGPGRPGIAGVVQAQHNLWLHLNRVPIALNLKRILDSQRDLSHRLAARVADTDAELSQKWHARAETFTRLFAETRNLGGLAGGGGAAAAEGANAVGRLRQIPPGEGLPRRALQDLDRIFERTDARLANAIDQGVTHRLYFIKARVPEVDECEADFALDRRAHFIPVTSPVQTDLLGVVHEELRPRLTQQRPPSGTATRRHDFQEAIVHRPERQAPRAIGD